MSLSWPARPGVFRGALDRNVPVRALFAFHLDVDVLHVRIDELEREVGLPLLLLDEHVLAVVDFHRVALRAWPSSSMRHLFDVGGPAKASAANTREDTIAVEMAASFMRELRLVNPSADSVRLRSRGGRRRVCGLAVGRRRGLLQVSADA
jgi:hypothetical protein